MKILRVDIFVLVRTWVPSMHATTVGILLAGGTSRSAGRLVVASAAAPTHASERPERCPHGDWSMPMVSATKF